MGIRENRLLRRRARIQAKIKGTASRPRLSVYRSLRYLECQLIDDTTACTLLALTDRHHGKKKKEFPPCERAKKLGSELAVAAQAKGIKKVVFDRRGFKYHGRIKALAEAARQAGLQF